MMGVTTGPCEVLRELSRKDPHLRAVSLSRNFGHQYAITAGMEYARGEAVVVMDADLQHPPELIPKMVDAWQRGAGGLYRARGRREGFLVQAMDLFGLLQAHELHVGHAHRPRLPPISG